QFAMVYCVKKLFQVHIYSVVITSCHVLLTLIQCLMCVAFWPEPITVCRKLGFVEFTQFLGYGLLDYSVHYCGNTQISLLPIVFRYLCSAYRIRAVLTVQNTRY